MADMRVFAKGHPLEAIESNAFAEFADTFGSLKGVCLLRFAGGRMHTDHNGWSRVRCFRFLSIADTGTRVPRNTQAQLTFPGMLSITWHFDQSSMKRLPSNSMIRELCQCAAALSVAEVDYHSDY